MRLVALLLVMLVSCGNLAFAQSKGTLDLPTGFGVITPATLSALVNAALGSKADASNPVFSGRIAIGPRTFIQEVNGDTWITANAYYDGTNWQRVDITKAAWGIELQGSNNFPGEPEQGASLWRAKPCANPINPTYATVCGWEIGWTIQSSGTEVNGGAGLEVDGDGTVPYGRFFHNTIAGSIYTGVVSNAFVDFSGTDMSTAPSWFAGFVGDEFVVQRAPATSGAPAFTTMMYLDAYGDLGTQGNLSVGGTAKATGYTENLSTPASSSAPCTAGEFTDDADYHYVCVATDTWKRVALSSW